jgi:hypothetical protein
LKASTEGGDKMARKNISALFSSYLPRVLKWFAGSLCVGQMLESHRYVATLPFRYRLPLLFKFPHLSSHLLFEYSLPK